MHRFANNVHPCRDVSPFLKKRHFSSPPTLLQYLLIFYGDKLIKIDITTLFIQRFCWVEDKSQCFEG